MFLKRTKIEVLAFWLLLMGGLLADNHEVLKVTGSSIDRDFLKTLPQVQGWKQLPSRKLRPGEDWTSRTGRQIINLDWQPPAAALAALSDHPEKVENPGGLFFGGLSRLRPVIFQYYHLGRLDGASPNLALYLFNPGSQDAEVHIRQGIGKPSLDYFSTGHTNNVEWFASLEQNLGAFHKIKAGQTVKVFQQELPKEYVVSGTLGLTQVEGPPLQFSLVARPSHDWPLSLNNLLKKDDVHSRGFYPVPVQRIERVHHAGAPPLNLVVGAVRQQTFSGVRELRGDYGVTYEALLTLVNDSNAEKTVRLYFNPRGGAATATFHLDDEVIEVPNTEAFKKREFHQITLRANEKRELKLQTIPEGASSYPIRIVVE